jgi:5-methylcytosine-specific restriction endonuclease McrA
MIFDVWARKDGTTFQCNPETLSETSKKWIKEKAVCAISKQPLNNSAFDGKKEGLHSLWIDRQYYNEFCEIHSRENKRERSRKTSETRKIRVNKAEGFFLQEDIDAIYNLQSGKCYYCKCELKRKNGKPAFEIEHITPLSNGGTNWPSNLSLACKKCNQKKGNKSAKDFWPIAKKMYDKNIISNSQKINKKHPPHKIQLTKIRKQEIANLYIFLNSPFFKIKDIIERNNGNTESLAESEFRTSFFHFLDFIIEKISLEAFEKTKSKLNKSQKFSLLLAQYLLIEAIHTFLENKYEDLKDFQTRFDYGELFYDARNMYPANEFGFHYSSYDPLLDFASDETEKEIPEFLEFVKAISNYLDSYLENDFSQIKSSFLNINKKYSDIRAIRKRA